jgi:hypothetical protein
MSSNGEKKMMMTTMKGIEVDRVRALLEDDFYDSVCADQARRQKEPVR